MTQLLGVQSNVISEQQLCRLFYAYANSGTQPYLALFYVMDRLRIQQIDKNDFKGICLMLNMALSASAVDEVFKRFCGGADMSPANFVASLEFLFQLKPASK